MTSALLLEDVLIIFCWYFDRREYANKERNEAKIVELKEIMKGCGLDPKKGLDHYVKIGEYLYQRCFCDAEMDRRIRRV